MATTWQKLDKGVRARPHLTRKHGLKPDMYFSLRYTIDGKEKNEALGWASDGWTLAKAREVLAQLRLAHTTGEGDATLQAKRDTAKAAREAEASRPTIARLWGVYTAGHEGQPSLRVDTCNYRAYLEPRFADKVPDDIRTTDIKQLRSELEAMGKAAQTVKHVMGLLRRIIRYGARDGLCTVPDISKLYFDMPKVDNVKTECLTPEQGKALLAALDADPDQNLANLMRLALATGIRHGALLALEWRDIDFEKGFITLRGESAKSGKTSTVPLTKSARAILSNIPPQRSAYVFASKDDKKRVSIYRFLNRIKEAANLPKSFRPLHGLRHTYASWLASSGEVTLLELQTLLTHNSPQMTLRYAHLADKAIRKAADVIDNCLDIAANADMPKGAKISHMEK